MAKTKQSALIIPNPPLHVVLSDQAAAALNKIRARFSWNKKTAVETALIKLAGGAK